MSAHTVDVHYEGRRIQVLMHGIPRQGEMLLLWGGDLRLIVKRVEWGRNSKLHPLGATIPEYVTLYCEREAVSLGEQQ